MDSATEIKTVAGESGKCNATQADIESKIVDFLWWMKKQGYRETTIVSRGSRLRRLVNLNANLHDVESVKETIAQQQCWKDSRKEAIVFAYDLFLRWQGLKCNAQDTKRREKYPSYLRNEK